MENAQRKTYPQNWAAYRLAQINEKERFQILLSELCKGIEDPIQTFGRPRFSFADMIFCAVFKVYSTVSARRFMTDLREAHGKEYISKLPCYNSIFNYFEMENMTAYLKHLITESSLPLKSVESDFAVDSSGFSTGQTVKWLHQKYTKPHIVEKTDWLKLHIMCGVKTNIVTSVEITHRDAGDSPYFAPLFHATANNFNIKEVSADKVHISANVNTYFADREHLDRDDVKI